jgi:hypothetical protein
MRDRLDELADICRSLRSEIQSPHDHKVEDGLFLILEELRYLRDEFALRDNRLQEFAEKNRTGGTHARD